MQQDQGIIFYSEKAITNHITAIKGHTRPYKTMLRSERPQLDAKFDKEHIKQWFSFAKFFCSFCYLLAIRISRPRKATQGLTRQHEAIQFHKSSTFIHDHFLSYLKIFFVPLHLEHFLLMFPRQEEEEQQQQQQQQKLLLGPLSIARGQKVRRNFFHTDSFFLSTRFKVFIFPSLECISSSNFGLKFFGDHSFI